MKEKKIPVSDERKGDLFYIAISIVIMVIISVALLVIVQLIRNHSQKDTVGTPLPQRNPYLEKAQPIQTEPVNTVEFIGDTSEELEDIKKINGSVYVPTCLVMFKKIEYVDKIHEEGCIASRKIKYSSNGLETIQLNKSFLWSSAYEFYLHYHVNCGEIIRDRGTLFCLWNQSACIEIKDDKTCDIIIPYGSDWQ